MMRLEVRRCVFGMDNAREAMIIYAVQLVLDAARWAWLDDCGFRHGQLDDSPHHEDAGSQGRVGASQVRRETTDVCRSKDSAATGFA